MIRFSIILQLCSPRAGSQAEGECFTSENNLQSFSKVKLFLPRRKEALIQFPLVRYGYMILTHFLFKVFVCPDSQQHTWQWVWPSFKSTSFRLYIFFLLNSSNKNSSLLQTAKGSLKPVLGGPTCLKDDKPNDVASLLYPAAYPFLDKWYLGYAMASGTYGMRKFEQEFLLASVAFHINSSFAGKVSR